jgi:hypothetical protein
VSESELKLAPTPPRLHAVPTARVGASPNPRFVAPSNDGRGCMRNRWLMFPQQNRLEIRLLGTFQVVVDGRPAGTGGSKRDALLGLLALRRGRPASVDALIDELWGSDMPASPRNAVQHHVARLRATLGQDAIVGTPNGYALAAASTDALVFEDLLRRGACRPARGPPRRTRQARQAAPRGP